MSFEIVETEKYIMKVYPESHYMEYVIKEGATMEVEDVAASREQVIHKFPGATFYVYAEGAGFLTMSKKARELAASKEHLDNTIAIAIYTPNISVYLLAELFHKINKPAVPTRLFRNRNDAREWLREQAAANGLSPQF